MNRTFDAQPLPQHAGPLEGAWPHRRRDLALTALAATAAHALVYMLANHYPVGAVQQLPLTALDLAVPLWPWTVFIYLSDYALLFVAFQCCRTHASADRFLLTEFGVITCATLVHWAYPVAFPRELFPVPADVTGLSRLGLESLRFFDASTSCLPSLHVAAALLAPLLISREAPRLAPWLFGWALLVIASTLTTKQHYAVDVLAGAALGLAAYLVANLLRPLHPPP